MIRLIRTSRRRSPLGAPRGKFALEREARLIEESMRGHRWSADPNGKFVYVSPKTLTYVGQPAENLDRIEGTDDCGWRQVVHPDDYDRVAARWLHSLKTGEPFESEHRIRHFDGTYRWFRNAGMPSRDDHGRVVGWYGTMIDIEEQKQAEAELRDRERELSQLVDMVPGHLWRLTPDGEPIFFNKRMVDFLGLDVADTGKPGMSRLEAAIETVVHPDDAAEFSDALSRCLVTARASPCGIACAASTASIAGCRAARSRCGIKADASSIGTAFVTT